MKIRKRPTDDASDFQETAWTIGGGIRLVNLNSQSFKIHQ